MLPAQQMSETLQNLKMPYGDIIGGRRACITTLKSPYMHRSKSLLHLRLHSGGTTEAEGTFRTCTKHEKQRITCAPRYTSWGMKRFCHRVSSSGGSTLVIRDLNLDVEAQKMLLANCGRSQIAFVQVVTAPAAPPAKVYQFRD